MLTKRLGFIGAGKMASAMIAALILRKVSKPTDIIASAPHEYQLEVLQGKTLIETTTDNKVVVIESDIVFLCVKPAMMKTVLAEIKERVTPHHLCISIAAGIPLKQLESWLTSSKNQQPRVIRVMPNTPCLVGEMAGAYALGSYVIPEDKTLIKTIMDALGNVFCVPEEDLDAITALSGSGPAYFALFTELLIESAVAHGLSKEVATELAVQTCLGTGKLLKEQQLAPSTLMTQVASPGGTTEQALKVFHASRLKETIAKAFAAAVQRSKELQQAR
ncbi:pyrroline-5-carboxylate reductase [Candidatus Woesearchaeota archaeon]|nr:pyrroline-5-carboxylate reductase [Candidatus Woesearchaeota archaeon]